jgi:uncharacterized protein YeaO (DUF488 family)
MKVQVKRAYEKPAKKDGFRVLVDRLWPRGIKKEDAKIDLWLKEAAPSTELRKWYGHDPKKWEEFKKRYYKELAAKDDLLEPIRKEAKKQTVTLVYSSKEKRYNNAVALRELLSREPARVR